MAMSGGIDSTVAAMLLLDQGYELVGVTYRVYDQISQACMEKEKGCCSVNAIFEAKHMAQQMGFEHHILDIRKDFNDLVIRNFIDEYLQGHTPNPVSYTHLDVYKRQTLRSRVSKRLPD